MSFKQSNLVSIAKAQNLMQLSMQQKVGQFRNRINMDLNKEMSSSKEGKVEIVTGV